MAFKWEVYEVSREGETKRTSEINVRSIIVTGTPSWEICPPDAATNIALEAGGIIEKIGGSGHSDGESSPDESSSTVLRDIDKPLVQTIILIAVIALGLSFLAVVLSELVRGSLSFDKFVAAIMSFLSGVGVTLLKQGKSQKED